MEMHLTYSLTDDLFEFIQEGGINKSVLKLIFIAEDRAKTN
jgi:hypothetical protein